MNLEAAYHLSKVPPRDENVAREAALRERFPVREMIKRGWIKATTSSTNLEKSVLAYFQVPDVTHPSSSPTRPPQLWGGLVYRSVCVAVQSSSARERASRARVLRAKAPGRDPRARAADDRTGRNPAHPRILSEAGVRLVIVEPIPGSKIQGVCFWLDNNTSPVIGLSLNGDQIDKFWFNLWHEIEHVLRGDGKDGMIIDDFDEAPAPEDECERAANEAAADRCVPAKAMKDFILRHSPIFSEKNMIGFSRIMKRHPALLPAKYKNGRKVGPVPEASGESPADNRPRRIHGWLRAQVPPDL